MFSHSVVYPPVVDRGDSLQMWWIAMNMQNKLQTADKGWSYRLGVTQGVATLHNTSSFS